jgi:L-2-hydroxyglutarate oxidase LhgO
MDRVDAVVVGAGIVGLAIARALAGTGRDVIVLEAENAIGTHTSSRNNEVVHAGFLHEPETLKGRLCKPGRELLLDYCRARAVPVRITGKLMPAVEQSELPALEALHRQGMACGVGGLAVLTGREARAREPSLHCHGALWSPATAIVDTHALMLALQGEAEANGAVVALESRATGGSADADGILVRVAQRRGVAHELQCAYLVNAAGLGARDFAVALRGGGASIPRVANAKGSFFALAGAAPFRHLIVPLGDTLAAGGSFTLDLAGRGRFGGDIEWIDSVDYKIDANRLTRVVDAVRRYWPELEPRRLSPGYVGIRPRCWGPGEPPGDWAILGPEQHGICGLVELFGIDTPGLTASLAIADHVLRLLDSTGVARRQRTERAHVR